MFARVATKDDIAMVLDVFNSSQAVFAPELGPEGEEWAEGLLVGSTDPSHLWLLAEDELAVPFAIGNLNPSLNAKQFQVDIAIRPNHSSTKSVVQFFMDKADELHPGWDFWVDCSDRDEVLNNTFKELGFTINRYFYSMRVELDSSLVLDIPAGLTVRNLDRSNVDDMRIFYELHQDAFSTHFGFVPRTFETWLPLITSKHFTADDGVYVLEEDGNPVGFVNNSDEIAHLGFGFIHQIGVAKQHQRRGFGSLLLGVAFDHSLRRGYTHAELGVDTQNPTGAVSVYSKVGFETIAKWVQYER